MRRLVVTYIIVLLGLFGALFASESSTLRLTSTVSASLGHGFYTGEPLNGAGVIANTQFTNQVRPVAMQSNEVQPVGNYSFSFNVSGGFAVTLDVGAMYNAASRTQVPYILSYTRVHGNAGLQNGSLSVAGGNGPPTQVSEGQDPQSDPLVFYNGTSNGNRWASYTLSVTFNGTTNTEYGLPAGNYSGVIVAHISNPN